MSLLCFDNTCCCLSGQVSAACISVIGLASCVIEMVLSESHQLKDSAGKDCVNSLKYMLATLFQMANLLLVLAIVVENVLLIQIYVWLSLGYIVMGFVAAILELLFRMQIEGKITFGVFILDTVFLVVLFRCLPIVDGYRKSLEFMNK